MDAMTKLLYETKRLMMLRYPRFASEIASANISYRTDLKCHTAATDGKNIFFDPEYLAGLSEADRLFLIAHELMHIKFAHAFRLEDKNGEKRDMDTWNIATDAIINANLERDGFIIKEGYVNRPEALNYSAEEFYQLLLEEKKAKEQEQHQSNSEQDSQDKKESGDSLEQTESQNSENQDSQDQTESNNNGGETQQDRPNTQDDKSTNDKSDGEAQQIGDDHSLWEEAFEKRKNGDKSRDKSNSSQSDDKLSTDDLESDNFDEKEEFEKNYEERRTRAKENLERLKNEMLTNSCFSDKTNLGSVGESVEEFDWRLLLRREVEKTETIWSQRRSIAENNYAYRLEENDIDDEAETEVMIDVSGSVDLDLVKAFLRMIKPILKESKLKVGCFNEKFWGMKEIKNVSDIDNFEIPNGARGHSAWTEDWDLAVRSFTKKREINKIVFTDGEPCPGTMPKDDLKNENVIWLVYGNRYFKPCCGTVIQITSKQLERLYDCKVDEDANRKIR